MILLSCPAEPEALCQALIQALAETAVTNGGTSPVIRRLGPGADAAPRAGSLAVSLVIDSQGPHHLAAHLEWQKAQGARQEGPPLRIDVSDAMLSTQSHASFAQALLGATPALNGLIGHASRN